jgi:mono/diheme cytochrome c family protein
MRGTTLVAAVGLCLVAIAPSFAESAVLPRPRPQAAESPGPRIMETASVPSAAKGDGAAIYSEQCASCHQDKGEGVPVYFPPLAGNRDLFLSADFPVHVLLFGMKGKIDVDGKSFNGEMPVLNTLSDEQIAAVLSYVRGAWGNAALAAEVPPADVATIAKLRQLNNVTAQQVHALRAKLKAGADK